MLFNENNKNINPLSELISDEIFNLLSSKGLFNKKSLSFWNYFK